jgi:beta-phosphoglucomutase-like phosphatase (HAD superfamily)
VVEDSLPGLHAGVAAGMQVYALRPSQPLPEALRGQVRLVSDLRELHGVLAEGC